MRICHFDSEIGTARAPYHVNYNYVGSLKATGLESPTPLWLFAMQLLWATMTIKGSLLLSIVLYIVYCNV